MGEKKGRELRFARRRWPATTGAGKGLAALKMYVLTVRTVHGTGGTCWAGLGLSGSGSSSVALPFRSRQSPREGSSDVVRGAQLAGRKNNQHRAEADGNGWLLLLAGCQCTSRWYCGIVPSRKAEVAAEWSQVPCQLSIRM